MAQDPIQRTMHDLVAGNQFITERDSQHGTYIEINACQRIYQCHPCKNCSISAVWPQCTRNKLDITDLRVYRNYPGTMAPGLSSRSLRCLSAMKSS